MNCASGISCGQSRRCISVRLDSSRAPVSSRRSLIRRLRAVEPRAAVALGLEMLLGRRVEHRAEHGSPSTTSATLIANSGSPSANARVPSIGSTIQTRRRRWREPSSARSSDSQPSSGRAPIRMSCSSRSIARSASVTHLAGRLVPVARARRGNARARARRRRSTARRSSRRSASRSAVSLTGRPRSCRRCAASARRCRSGTRDRRPGSACWNISVRLPAIVISLTGQPSAPFSIQKPAAPRL